MTSRMANARPSCGDTFRVGEDSGASEHAVCHQFMQPRLSSRAAVPDRRPSVLIGTYSVGRVPGRLTSAKAQKPWGKNPIPPTTRPFYILASTQETRNASDECSD